jgi:hypothetical protein
LEISTSDSEEVSSSEELFFYDTGEGIANECHSEHTLLIAFTAVFGVGFVPVLGAGSVPLESESELTSSTCGFFLWSVATALEGGSVLVACKGKRYQRSRDQRPSDRDLQLLTKCLLSVSVQLPVSRASC